MTDSANFFTLKSFQIQNLKFEIFRMETMFISCKNKNLKKINEKTMEIEHFYDNFLRKLVLSF